MKTYIVIAILIIAGSLYLPALRPSLAQEPTAEPTPTPESTPAGEPTPTPESTPAGEPTPTPESTPAGEPPPTPEPARGDETRSKDITFEDLGYGDRGLSSGFAYVWTYFYVPGDLVFVPGSHTRLTVSHTGGQTEKPATLVVELNYHVLDIVQLTVENDNRAQIHLDISPEHLETGRNRLKVTLRSVGNSCYQTDEYQPDELPVEAVLHSEGLLHLVYEVVPREPELALYPVPFLEREFEPSVVYFVLPDSPTPDDMTVAATISAGLGRYLAGEIEFRSVTASELTSEIWDNYNLIVIGLPEANAFLSQLSLPLSLEEADIADDHGVLQEITSPWNPRRMVLIVTGRTLAGVLKAGAALNRQILFPGFKGQAVIVEELLDPPEDEVETLVADETLEDLGYGDTVIYGTQPTNERFYFYMPRSWQLSEDPSLKLFFTHSETLSNTISTLSVSFNGVPIGSTLLDHSNSKDGLLEVELLSWLLKSGSNRIDVFVDMSMGKDECLYWTSGQAWTVIGRNSTLHLLYEPQPAELDLANLFRPFSYEPDLSDTYIVLPETLNQAGRDTLLMLAARLGAAASGSYITLQAGQANDLNSDPRQTYHIVAIGQPSTNPLIREVNDFLPQPFLPGRDEPSQIHNPAIITFDPQRSIGFVQLAASPWNSDKALLVVTGTDSEGVAAAFDVLVNRTGELKGDLAMIEDEYLITLDTRPLQVNRGGETMHVVRPDTPVLVALAERWW